MQEPPLHLPAKIALIVSSEGAGTFEVMYNDMPPNGVSTQRLAFPFGDVPVENLDIPGAAARHYVETNAAAVFRVGMVATIEYLVGKTARQLTGLVMSADDSAVTVKLDGGLGVQVLHTKHVVSVVYPSAGDLATLAIRTTVGVIPRVTQHVRGTDTKNFAFSARHVLQLEPNLPFDQENLSAYQGEMIATISSTAGLRNGYPHDIRIDSLSLVEIQRPMVQTRAAPAAYETRAAAVQLDAPSAQSGTSQQTGSVRVDTSRGNSSSNAADTGILLRGGGTAAIPLMVYRISSARMYYLVRDFNPIVLAAEGTQLGVATVLRMGSLSDLPFMFSGPIEVRLDMDPLPGPDHVSDTTISSFQWNPWEPRKERFYHVLGDTSAITPSVRQVDETSAVHNTTTNTHEISVELCFQNNTPYPALVKHYLRAPYGQVLNSVTIKSGDTVAHTLLDRFVPEQDSDFVDREAKTLVVLVPAGNGYAVRSCVVLRVAYSMSAERR
jgi:hypothetical protein